MNTETIKPVNHLLDPEWIVAIQEQLDTYPAAAIALIVEPALLGRFHGECGKPCQANLYYTRLGDIAEYEQGWREAEEILAAAMDYEDWIEDMNWIRQGC